MIPVAEPYFDENEFNNLLETIKTGWISSKGEFISRFEQAFAKYCNMKYSSSTSNGTTALHLALLAVGIKPGDEVIVPSLAFIAPVNTVRYCGAKPVFVDVNKDYWGIDPEKIKNKITKKTKAIIPVHLYGHPCDMESILEIAKKYNLYVIEDAAEAHGAEYKGKKVGSFGDISCFSFFGNKNIITGEGGMCLTNNEKFLEKINLFKNHGMSKKKRYWHEVVGYNYRMTNMQAAVGLAQLKKLDKFIEKKNQIANLYRHYLKDLINQGLITPHPKMPWAKNVIWLYSILINSKSRDEIMKKLAEKGIDTRPLFYPIHQMPPYKEKNKYPISEDISRRGISLPSSVKLKKEEIEYICNELRNIL